MTNFESLFPLGREKPSDYKHISKYPFSAMQYETVDKVERALRLPPYYRLWYDQKSEGACVGHGTSGAMSIINGRRYNPWWLWDRAKEIDEWPSTNPGDSNGTSVRAAMDVLRNMGHCRVYGGKNKEPDVQDGIAENRWATTVDEMRTCIANGVPISIGVDWYSTFDRPVLRPEGKRQLFWLPEPTKVGRWRGGHCVCVYGASDRLQAFRFVNSWGSRYPLALIPYATMQMLLDDYGEATIITDRM